MDADDLRQQVSAARARLIASLEGASESDFNADLEPGVTVVGALADLARRQRAALEDARRLAELAPRPSPVAHGDATRRLTPPPVVHDLAGAHHEAILLIDALAALDPAQTGVARAAGDTLLAVIGEERALADRIALRIGRTPAA
ncbi:MAG: hypothetical protein K1X87_00380 [Dehalococcoidia bacterium]|nr:hypothetical protein [Dehalococcoidia bacterium]